MKKHFKLMGAYFWLLGIFTVGRNTIVACLGYAMGGSLKADA